MKIFFFFSVGIIRQVVPCKNLFTLEIRLQDIFFLYHQYHPSKVKWSAPHQQSTIFETKGGYYLRLFCTEFCFQWITPPELSFPVTTQLLDASHSTKTFEETAADGAEIARKSFQKFRKLANFRNTNYSTKNSRSSGSKVE